MVISKRKRSMKKHLSRRSILQAPFVIGACVAAPALLRSGSASAVELSKGQTNLTIHPLSDALRATRKPVCVKIATHLEGLKAASAGFDLHLRSAGLELPDAIAIAAALGDLPVANAPALRSFSVSYNPGIGDAGASALLAALPASVTEIGMVGCGLRDASGQTLLDWTQQARNITMICVEGNEYSPQMRDRISNLRQARPGLFIVV
ncbi:MAG: hypothetical protein ACJA1E_000390 [Paracoccaceae bacterium]|jgi:hypothetical protein